MKLFKKLAGAGTAETLKEGTKLIDEIFTRQEEKLQGKMELFKMAVADRSSAREMYQNDSWLQKAFAIFFLIAWCGLTFIMLNYFIFDSIQLDDWQIAFNKQYQRWNIYQTKYHYRLPFRWCNIRS